MILVSGAAGKTGRAVVGALVGRGAAVRAWVRREAQAAGARAQGAAEVVAGEAHDADALRAAVFGARAVYHICPNVHPAELEIGRALMAVARAAGVEHFIFHSVLHPQTQAMPHHWQKLRVEEALFESGLTATILQPAPYMQNSLAQWATARAEGVWRVPYPVATCLSLVDLADVAEAAATVLTEPGHAGATYELVGTPGLAQTELAAEAGRALGRAVRAEQEPADVWAQRARAGGLGEYQVTTLLAMFNYYARFGLCGSPTALGWLLGRAPASYAHFAAAAAAGQAG